MEALLFEALKWPGLNPENLGFDSAKVSAFAARKQYKMEAALANRKGSRTLRKRKEKESGTSAAPQSQPTDHNSDTESDVTLLSIAPEKQPKDFKAYMEDRLPHQAVLYLLACGFDSEASFLSFNSSGNEEDSLKLIEHVMRTESDILKENTIDSRTMYGMYYDSPQSFKVLPGHKSAIQKFVLDVQKGNECSEAQIPLHVQSKKNKICRPSAPSPRQKKKGRNK